MAGYSLEALAEALNAKLVMHDDGQSAPTISGIQPLSQAGTTDISFLAGSRYVKALPTSQAAVVILSESDLKDCPCHALVVEDPYLAFAKAAYLFQRKPKLKKGIHPTAVIGEGSSVAKSASIAAHVVIGDHVRLGENVRISAGCVLEDHVTLGDDTELKPNVTLYHDVIIGARCLIHSGVVIGSDGFGLVQEQGRWLKIPQLGSVQIGDGVEVGANTTIDRGALGNTIVHDGVKLDNQVHLAHNVEVGEATAMAAKVGVAGSAKIGKHCLIGGDSGINGHIELADQVCITGKSTVTKSLRKPGVYSSTWSVKEQGTWAKTIARIHRLDKLIERVSALEAKFNLMKNIGK